MVGNRNDPDATPLDPRPDQIKLPNPALPRSSGYAVTVRPRGTPTCLSDLPPFHVRCMPPILPRSVCQTADGTSDDRSSPTRRWVRTPHVVVHMYYHPTACVIHHRRHQPPHVSSIPIHHPKQVSSIKAFPTPLITSSIHLIQPIHPAIMPTRPPPAPPAQPQSDSWARTPRQSRPATGPAISA